MEHIRCEYLFSATPVLLWVQISLICFEYIDKGKYYTNSNFG